MSELKARLAKPPLNILVNPTTLRGKRPWEIDLEALLDMLLQLLAEVEPLDLRLCGTAALSSAIIYRLKVETLFIFEALRARRPVQSGERPPGFLQLPFRYELPSTTLEELLTILERVLREAAKATETKRAPPEPPLDLMAQEAIEDSVEENLEALLAPFREMVAQRLRELSRVLFRELARGLDLLGRVRLFMALLFMANDGHITLWEEEGELVVARVSPYGP